MRHECRHGHTIRGPQDVLPSGDCRHCDRERVAKYRAKCKAGFKIAHALEMAGLTLDEIPDKAERLTAALRMVLECDPIVLDHLRRMDPDTFTRALDNVRQAAAERKAQ